MWMVFPQQSQANHLRLLREKPMFTPYRKKFTHANHKIISANLPVGKTERRLFLLGR
jgi:hypothetical protein